MAGGAKVSAKAGYLDLGRAAGGTSLGWPVGEGGGANSESRACANPHTLPGLLGQQAD